MEQQTAKTMTNEQLIGACVRLDREQKKSRAMMNSYKAELQARGLALMGRPQCEVCEVLW